MKHIGNLKITKDNENEFKELVEVTGDVYVSGEAKLDAPKLETVGGYVSVSGEAKLPKLETVGGSVYVSGEAKLPKLETVGGSVYVSVYGEAKLPKLETVGGYVSVYGEAKLDAPKLETVGGYVYVYGEAKLPKLETVGGSVYGEAKLPKLETVGGYVSVYGEAKLPKLETKNDPYAKYICKFNLQLSLWLKGFALLDGVLSWVLGEKTVRGITILKVQIVGKLETSFVAQRGDTFSHGKTIAKAIEDLRYKISDRDTSEFKAWKKDLNMTVSLEDAIAAYRVITGACESGVRGFVESITVPDKLTPNVILELTKGRYGNEEFGRFLNE